MGQEIDAAGFEERDFAAFREQLARETGLLRQRLEAGKLSGEGPRIGFELEAWLVDRHFFPVPDNQEFLSRLADPLVVPELSRFNIEVNGSPQPLAGDGLLRLERELEATWSRCLAAAHERGETVLAIGTLPTLRESDLSLASMTPSNRYAALNRELVRMRGGAPVQIAIDSACEGGEPLRTSHVDVMLEAAATSFQLHLQVPADRLCTTLNASMVLSAPLMAIAANAPFLFGRALWHETRIAIFEQAFEQAPVGAGDTAPRRVTFGNGYAGADPAAIFDENVALYPVLLPLADSTDVGRYSALRLHNGTVWRWNRPLVGFDDDGTPHLRIEQRILPAGPTVIDMIANAAFYYGVVHVLANRPLAPDKAMPFAVARDNFYAAARHGLDAEVTWLDGQVKPVRAVLAHLVPLAREGLRQQGVDPDLADRYCDVIEVRLRSGRNGAGWQLAHHARHGDLSRLTAEYTEHQRSGMPVHEWTI